MLRIALCVLRARLAAGATNMIRRASFFIAVALCLFALMPDGALAAGSAYQVDTAEVAEPGRCKVETWASFASNRDFIGALSPACVVEIARPVEVSTQLTRARIDGEWLSGATPKLKTNLVPTAIGAWGFAMSAQATWDLLTGTNAALAVTLPATLRLSNVLRVNLNAGWFRDRTAARDFTSYGAAFDWRTPDNMWTLTGEVFGLLGLTHVAPPPQDLSDPASPGLSSSSGTQRPRFQTGLRFRPVDSFSVDLIYGRNLTGENANWITAAMVVRW
jgi:hypothetical protein